jgi:hypothetical protein
MVRSVSRRIARLESHVAATTLSPIVFRILLVHPEEGVTEVLVLEGDKPTTRVPPTPEEVESVRADLKARRAGPLWKGGATDTHDYAPA